MNNKLESENIITEGRYTIVGQAKHQWRDLMKWHRRICDINVTYFRWLAWVWFWLIAGTLALLAVAAVVVWQVVTWIFFWPIKAVGRAFGNRRRDRKVEMARHQEMMAAISQQRDVA